MAKQLYDYWFVQFDFPNEEGKPYKSSGGKMVWNDSLAREIPEGWSAKHLNQIENNIITGKTPSTSIKGNFQGDIPFITIDDIRQELFIFNTSRTLTAKGANSQVRKTLLKGSLCCSCIGTPGILGFVGIAGQTNQQINSIIFHNVHNREFLYFSLDLYFQFASAKIGNILPNMSKMEFSKILLPYPSNRLVKRYHTIVNPIFQKIRIKTKELLELTKLRNSLLPLLMNGQVKVGVERSRLNYDLLLCLFLQIWYNATKKPMKEEIKTRIITAMAQNLSSEQMALLNIVLCDSFKNIEIIALGDEVSQRNKANNELLNAFIAAKKIEGCSDKTLHYYRSSIEALLAKLNKGIDVIVTNDIRNYLSDYQEERLSSRVTIDNLRRIFSSFFAWLEDEDYIGKSPVRRIHKVRTESLVKEVLSDENMEVLRDTCHEIRDLAMIDLLASTGMRVGELAKMNREDIDFQERQCVVFGKGNKEREVYFNARTKIHLKRYLESRKDTNPALFVSLSTPHNRLTISGVEVRLRQLGRKAGINKVHPHKFRRTLATMAIDKGMPIEQVQKLLGHVKIDTTLHYAMVNQTNVKIAHRKFIG